MQQSVKTRHGWLLTAVLSVVACGGEPTQPAVATGGIAAAINGLPVGGQPSVRVTGPDGYDQTIAASTTLLDLAPGTYLVNADDLQDGVHVYRPSPASQSVAVVASETPAAVQVDYGLITGGLAISVTGIPAGGAGDLQITGPGFDESVTGDQTFAGVQAGSYSIAASSIIAGSETYDPNPVSQVVEVAASLSPTPATVAYVATGSAPFNLTIEHAYLVQAIQRHNPAVSDVALVAGRDALLRVFVTASIPNGARPDVRVRLYRGGVLVDTQTLAASGSSVPTAATPEDLSSSWNLVVPAAQIQSDLTYLVDLDPTDAILEDNESDNVFPSDGMPRPVTVTDLPPIAVRLIPVFHDSTGRTGDVSPANLSEYVTQLGKVYPTAGVDADIGPVFTTSAPPLESNDGNNAWGQILSEIRALRLADGSARYYYGVVSPDYSSGIAGLGYVPGSPNNSSKASIGWDRGSRKGWVMAHEVGHNHGRRHSPGCGAGNPDQTYPHAGGSIGVYGLDLDAMSVKSPSTHFDFMSYCNTTWVSDYVFEHTLAWRQTEAAQTTTATTRVMLVWGRVTQQGLVLEPSFVMEGRPSLPNAPGPYHVSAMAEDGSPVFNLSFEGELVADLPGRPERHFAFMVPVDGPAVDRIRSLRFAGPEGEVETVGSGSPAVAAMALGYRVSRITESGVRLEWESGGYPMVMVRDRASGQIVALVRSGRAQVVGGQGELELSFSDGIRSTTRTVLVD